LKNGISAYVSAELGGQFLQVGFKEDATIILYSEPGFEGKSTSVLVKFMVK